MKLVQAVERLGMLNGAKDDIQEAITRYDRSKKETGMIALPESAVYLANTLVAMEIARLSESEVNYPGMPTEGK